MGNYITNKKVQAKVIEMVDRFKIPYVIYKKYSFLKKHYDQEEFYNECIMWVLEGLEGKDIIFPPACDNKAGYELRSQLKQLLFTIIDNHALKIWQCYKYPKRQGIAFSLEGAMDQKHSKTYSEIGRALTNHHTPETDLLGVEHGNLIDEALVALSKVKSKHPLHMLLYYKINGDTYDQIGEKLGMSRQAIQQTFIAKIYPVIQSLRK